MGLEFFGKDKENKTLGNLKRELQRLDADETRLWELSKDAEQRQLIPQEIKDMKDRVSDIAVILQDIHVTRVDAFHNFIHTKTTLSQELNNRLNYLEQNLQDQVRSFTDHEYDSSEGYARVILDQGKTHPDKFSRTRHIILDCIKLCDEMEEELSIRQGYNVLDDIKYSDLCSMFVNDPEVKIALPEELLNRFGDLYKVDGEGSRWYTSGSFLISPRNRKLKVILSKKKSVNKLLEPRNNRKQEHVHALGDYSYDSIAADNKEVFEFSLDDEDIDSKIISLIVGNSNQVGKSVTLRALPDKREHESRRDTWEPIVIRYFSKSDEMRIEGGTILFPSNALIVD